jgi:hypothetical protein
MSLVIFIPRRDYVSIKLNINIGSVCFQCIFIIWCYLPTEYNGSLVIYYRVIRPYYQKHHGRIDNIANSGETNFYIAILLLLHTGVFFPRKTGLAATQRVLMAS